jgi:excisionase family DNA binding protein
MSDAELMSNEDLAAYVVVPLKTVEAWRYRGTGPRGIKVGRHVRYRKTDVDQWLDDHADDAQAS